MNQKATCPHCKQVFEVPGELYNTIVTCPSCDSGFNPMNEYVKAGVAAMHTPEFQESFKADIIAPANEGISHAEFVTGVRNRTIGLNIPSANRPNCLQEFEKSVFPY